MYEIPHRRRIVARAELLQALGCYGRVGGPLSDPSAARALALEVLRPALQAGEAELRRRFESGGRAREILHGRSYLIDQLVRVLFDFASTRVWPLANPTEAEKLSILAVGGYGRGELAPQSDIDLLFLFPYKQTSWGEQVAEFMLYSLWDLGLKVGHATRSVSECLRRARDDVTISTAILESRWIWGDQDLAQELARRFDAEVVAKTGAAYVQAKLTELRERHSRMGDSRYLVEPNLKEGQGGLRDLQTLVWIARFFYRIDDLSELVGRGIVSATEYRRLIRAQAFLAKVRCHLHYVTGRPEERLTFDVQTEIAHRMGYTDRAGQQAVERFMKFYFLTVKDVGDVTRIFFRAVEEEVESRSLLRLPRIRRKRTRDGFVTDGKRVTVENPDVFRQDPVRILRLFHLAEAQDLDLHPDALRAVRSHLDVVNAALRKNAEANRLFVDLLTWPGRAERALRRLNEAGVLGRFVTDFGRVVAQTQHDMYHVYTVDEHTIRAIGILSRIEQGTLAEDHPLATEVIKKVLSRRVLYLALFLHDIAKGRGGDHSVLGAEVAHKLAPRLGFTEAETETVAWLVRWHLALSATAFKRDLADPKTITDIARHVQSPERLRLLLVLTVCDIRAVGPNVWNGWKGQLLRTLYVATEDVLLGGHVERNLERNATRSREELTQRLADWPAEELDAYLNRHMPYYWQAFDIEAHERHARMIRRADRAGDPLTLETRTDSFRAITEVTIYTQDHPGLFARLTGALSAAGATIVDAKVHTTRDGQALDTFLIQDLNGDAFDRPDRLARLSRMVNRTLAGEVKPRQAIAAGNPGEPARMRKVFKVAPVVLIDNGASASHTVIEVNGRDRPGLLYDVTWALFTLNLTIHSAHVATYGERAVDVFYVQDLVGMKVTSASRLAPIEAKLLEALLTPEERAAGGAAKAPARGRSRSREREKAAAG
ncbi:[protein-PII] uridylyltransferase [Marinibaculum pumilum]|uniref:Bifunctional uridylyltransferase/uridylyl-removing enzyme n=1 Tax=Marinibaculum pumilum TaxID=1766165 RepID=A0ABV7L5Z3_9PROT